MHDAYGQWWHQSQFAWASLLGLSVASVSKEWLQTYHHHHYFKPKIRPEQPPHIKTQPIELACTCGEARFLGCFAHTVLRAMSCTCTYSHTRTCTPVLWNYDANQIMLLPMSRIRPLILHGPFHSSFWTKIEEDGFI